MPARGIRNNNPGNIEYRKQDAATGSDGRFAIFETPEAGLGEMAEPADPVSAEVCKESIKDIIYRWAPPSEDRQRMPHR